MAGKVKMTLPTGKVVDGTEVQVRESNEKWSDVTLEDGTIVRVKMTVLSASRADDEYDPAGAPFYALNMTPVVAVVSVPDKYKKKA
jgi:hypothetical protein